MSLARQLLAGILAIALVVAACAPSWVQASNSTITYPASNPQSTLTNQQARNSRDALGAAIMAFLGPTTSAGGVYSNLTLSPATGLYVATAPTVSNTLGLVFQLIVSDPNAMPAGSFSPALSTDPNEIVPPALQSSTSANIGPLTPPGSNSVYWLVEAQVQVQDTTPATYNFIPPPPTPHPYSQTLNSQRSDVIVYQAKEGTPGATPSPPAVDSGWIGIGYVLVPSGTSTITSGMISQTAAAVAPFNGFLTSVPTACPSAGTNISVTGSYPCTVNNTAPSPAPTICPSPGSNVTVSTPWPCTIAATTPTPLPSPTSGNANCTWSGLTISCATPTPLPSPTSGNGNCAWTGLSIACTTPTPAPTPSPVASTGITISGSYPYTFSATGSSPVSCTSSSSVPCYFTWSCSISAASCSTTVSVPASSVCGAWFTSNPQYSVSVTYSGAVVGGGGGTAVVSGTLYSALQTYVSLSSTTLTIEAVAGSGYSITASPAGNGGCL